MLMTERLLGLSERELRQAIEPYAEEFIRRDSDDDALSESSHQLVNKGIEAAAHIPAVKFIVDTTLRLVNRPEIESTLPKEVYERQAVASIAAERIASTALESGYITAYYVTNPYLDSDVGLHSGIGKKYLGILGGAPFADTRVVAGGAFKLLTQASWLEDDPIEIIKRSRGLLVVSQIDKQKAKLAEQFLGVPYAEGVHFMGKKGEMGLELTFTDSTREAIRLLFRGSGCPAGRIALAGANGSTLLQQYWEKIVDYLLPADATTEGFGAE